MYRIYVLKSLKSGKRYVGITSQSLEDKLREHNSGATTWTRGHRPLYLIHSESYGDKVPALKRERYLKTGRGRKFLDTIDK